jgi:predicted DNA-binding protein (MmcQ/YjbR family)
MEVEAWGHPTFRVGNKIFATYAPAGDRHGDGRPATTFKAAPGGQRALVRKTPDRFFVPPYVGSKGWVAAWLDGSVNWDELAGLILCSYRLVAPKRILALMDEE